MYGSHQRSSFRFLLLAVLKSSASSLRPTGTVWISKFPSFSPLVSLKRFLCFCYIIYLSLKSSHKFDMQWKFAQFNSFMVRNVKGYFSKIMPGYQLLQAIYYVDKSEDKEHICSKEYVRLSTHQGNRIVCSILRQICDFAYSHGCVSFSVSMCVCLLYSLLQVAS